MEDIFDENLQPQKVQKKLLEKNIQKTCIDFARAKGCWVRKFSSPANRSVPDYLIAYIGDSGKHVKIAVEFKAPGKVSTKAQVEEQDLMEAAGWIVWRDIGTNGNDDIALFKRGIMDFFHRPLPKYPG